MVSFTYPIKHLKKSHNFTVSFRKMRRKIPQLILQNEYNPKNKLDKNLQETTK